MSRKATRSLINFLGAIRLISSFSAFSGSSADCEPEMLSENTFTSSNDDQVDGALERMPGRGESRGARGEIPSAEAAY